MSLEINKRTARRLYEEIIGQGSFDLVDELVAEDAIDHNAEAQGWPSGREGFRIHARFFANSFDDLDLSVDDLVAEGDRVIVFWSFRGIHKGEVWGVAPTGRRVTGSTITLIRVRDGRMVEYESRPDRLSLLTQFGTLGKFADAFAEGQA